MSVALQELIFAFYLLLQILLPLKRYFGALFLGKNLFTDYGSFFSWSQDWIMRVGALELNVRRKDGVRLFIIKTSSLEPAHVFGDIVFHSSQIFYILSSPYAVVQLADLLKKHLEKQGLDSFIITADYQLDINRRGAKVFIDPYADLCIAKKGAIYE